MPAITEDRLIAKIGEYTQQRDELLRAAQSHANARSKCIDDANTAHGAAVAAEQMLAELRGDEAPPGPLAPPPAEVTPLSNRKARKVVARVKADVKGDKKRKR